MKLQLALVTATLLFAPAILAKGPSWEKVQNESKPEKRAKLALEYAEACVDPVLEAYLEGEPGEGKALLERIDKAVVLAHESLVETGKHPRKRPKHFKRAEIATRRLSNDLQEAQRKLTFDERQDFDEIIAKVEEINRQLLLGIMQPK